MYMEIEKKTNPPLKKNKVYDEVPNISKVNYKVRQNKTFIRVQSVLISDMKK